MEPMTLGSPTSPLPGSANNDLPSFFMGESSTMTVPRSNTFSPTISRTLAFAASSPSTSTNDFSWIPSPHQSYSNVLLTPNHNAAPVGPPTKDLFDSLKDEQNSTVNNSYSSKYSLSQHQINSNQSYAMNQSVCDSFVNQSTSNVSRRITSPLDQSYDNRNNSTSVNCLSPAFIQSAKHWITVYGFPPSAVSVILTHFAKCGTILERILPPQPQSGNWIHLRFASHLECEKALNYHERILANSIMIGVTYCKDPSIVDKENLEQNDLPINRARPLAQVSYKITQSAANITGTPKTPSRSSGIVNKAIDLVFGW